MLSYTMYTTIDPTTVPPMVNIEERGRRLHNSNNTNTTSTSTPSSAYASDEEDDHIEPLKSNSRRNSILNFCYGLPTSSTPNSRSNSRTRSRSRSRPNIKIQDAPDAAAILYSLSTKAPVMALSPKQSANNSRRSSVELRGEYAELLEERSRPSSRVNSRANSRANSRVREPAHHHSLPHFHDFDQDHTHLTINKDTKKEKEHCGSDCATCGNCNTVKDTVLELDESNTPSKIQKPRRKSNEITGPYDSPVDNNTIEKSLDVEEVSPAPAACSSDSIERKLGFDISLLSF